MSDFNNGYARPIPPQSADMSMDVGLRAFMLGIYNKMALGLLVSALLAYLTSSYPPVRDAMFSVSPDGRLLGRSLFGTAVAFAPLLMMFATMFLMKNPSPASSGMLFWGFVTTIGAGAGIWLLMYTGTSVFLSFLITASAFGALSLVGYTTKKDLTGMGSFLIMGMWGLLIASLANMFFHLPMMSFIINVLGVIIFAGLTAYDTQRLKHTYYALGGDQTSMAVATNFGALTLYLDFINLFQFLMSFLGARRN
jgi:FtsH-binding integral membrane protein